MSQCKVDHKVPLGTEKGYPCMRKIALFQASPSTDLRVQIVVNTRGAVSAALTLDTVIAIAAEPSSVLLRALADVRIRLYP